MKAQRGMRFFQKLHYHLPRIQHQLGQRIRLSDDRYRVSGYHADRLAYKIDTEPFLMPVLRRVLRGSEGAFLDVGANVGQTLLKVLAVDPDRRYVGFEPQLECCFCIEKFLRMNNLANATIVSLALSNSTAMVPLFSDRPHDDTASILPTQAYAPEQRRSLSSWVPARPGDEVIEEMGIGEIAAIKIDVEGFELEVLDGLAATLRKQRPVVLFEVLSNYFWNRHVHPSVGHERSARADKIYQLLTGAGYAISQIDSRGDEHPINRFDLDTPPKAGFGNEGRDYVARAKS